MSQFFANFGYHPRVPGFTNPLTNPTKSITEDDILNPGTKRFSLDRHLLALQALWSITQYNMSEAQDRQSIQFNKKHRNIEFKEGEQVLLYKDAYVKGGARKFHHLWYGPFTIQKKLSPTTYKLNLGAKHPRKQDTFNIKYLRPYYYRVTLTHNVPPQNTKDIMNSLAKIEKVVAVFDDQTCEVRWNHAETWDTSILPVDLILQSDKRYLLDPFVKNGTLRYFRLEKS